jgi:4-aminobutyrate aminotransferase-like enzyme
LLIGVELVEDKASKTPLSPAKLGAVIERCKELGVIVGRSASAFGSVITICPPLVITRKECDTLVEVVGKAINEKL